MYTFYQVQHFFIDKGIQFIICTNMLASSSDIIDTIKAEAIGKSFM